MKACTRCGKAKPLDEFATDYAGTTDGRDFLCADCRALASAEAAERKPRPPANGGRLPQRIAYGKCATKGCSYEGPLYARPGKTNGRGYCLACLQAGQRVTKPCATEGCENQIPAKSRKKYCEHCSHERQKAAQRRHYARQKAAAQAAAGA